MPEHISLIMDGVEVKVKRERAYRRKYRKSNAQQKAKREAAKRAEYTSAHSDRFE